MGIPDRASPEQTPGVVPAFSTTAAAAASPSAADNDVLDAVAFALAGSAPTAAGLTGPDVVTVTETTKSLLLAARDASAPAASVTEFLSQLLGLESSLLAGLGARGIQSAVYAAVRRAAPLLDAAGVSLGASAPSSVASPPGGSGPNAPRPGAGRSMSGSGGGPPAPDPAVVLGALNSLPTDEELAWIQHVLRNRRYQVLRTYYTQWGNDIKGLPSFSEIQRRRDTAIDLQKIAAEQDSATGAARLSGWVRLRSSPMLGIAVHQAVQSQYLACHQQNLICVDSAVHHDGDVRSLGDVTARKSTGDKRTDQDLDLFAQAFQQLGLSDYHPLRSDIADLNLRTLYEIKPLSRAAEGVIQLWAYQAYLNMGFQYEPPRPGHPTAVFHEGDWPPAPLVLQISANPVRPIWAVVFQFTGAPQLPGFVALPGLLLYELYTYEGNDKDLAAAVATLALIVISTLTARGRRIGLAGPAANDDVERPEHKPGKHAARIWETLSTIALVILAILIFGLLAYLAYLLAMFIAGIVIAILLGGLLVAWDDTGAGTSSDERAALAANFLDAASRVAAQAGLDGPENTPTVTVG